MTDHNSLPLSPDPLIRTYLVQCALGISEVNLRNLVLQGRLPPPAVGGRGRSRLWKLSALRTASPTLADSVEILLKLPLNAAV